MKEPMYFSLKIIEFLAVLILFYFLTEPGPAQAMVCNLVKGTRIAHAIGREIGEKDESDLAKKVCSIISVIFSKRQLLSNIIKIFLHSAPSVYVIINSLSSVILFVCTKSFCICAVSLCFNLHLFLIAVSIFVRNIEMESAIFTRP